MNTSEMERIQATKALAEALKKIRAKKEGLLPPALVATKNYYSNKKLKSQALKQKLYPAVISKVSSYITNRR